MNLEESKKHHKKKIGGLKLALDSEGEPVQIGETFANFLERKGWIQNVKIKHKGICTGKNFGGENCKEGTPQYTLAKTFRKIAKKHKKD